jgi:tetratricopeptide (TPR) repeat protein
MRVLTCILLSILVFQTARSQVNSAGALLLEERYADALHITDSLLLSDSSNAQLYLYKGTALRGLGKYPEAISFLQKAHQLSPEISTALLIAGLQQESGNTPAAIESYNNVLLNDSLNIRALFSLGKLYLSEGQPQIALSCFDPLYCSDTMNFIYTRYMAETWDQLKNNDSAIYYYEKAILLNREDRNSVFRLGNLYIRINAFQAGMRLTDTFLSFAVHNGQKEDVKILKLNAYIYLLAFHPRNSIERFRRCLELGDSSVFTYKYLGLGYHDVSRYDSAVYCLQQARLVPPEDPEIFFFLGKCYGMMNKPDTAIACLRKTIELLNPSPSFISSIQIMIADNLNLLKKTDQALETLYVAKETDESPEVLFMLGRQYDFFGSDPDSAELYYKRFINKLDGQESQTREQHEFMERAKERLRKFQEDRFWLGLDSIPQK